ATGKSSARDVRKRVLGHPVLDGDARATRIAAVAGALGVTPAAVEQLLWSDLAKERLVVVPDVRPLEQALAATANVELLQRLVRRALHVRLVVWGDPRELVRTVSIRGLLATVTPAPSGTVIDIIGPLSLFHETTIYGRVLAAVIPLLAALDRYELTIRCDLGRGPGIVQLEPPILLPAAPPPRRSATALDTRLARALARDPAIEVDRTPAPIQVGDRVLFPDLAFTHAGRRRVVEILGFATADYLADKLARYAAGGVDVILCVDAARSAVERTHNVLPFTRQITASELLDG
ncbi:MAG: DUF790 family protein, partial [Deltaproteobacteria bacterium]|nr:DUF790 family protein [Deltaproteobacteria bacterium]